VHNDQPEKVTKKSFESFLCTNPFRSDRSVAKHACWLVDDQLIAFSVIDILPLGISSVYLVWDTDYAKYGLGRLACCEKSPGFKNGGRRSSESNLIGITLVSYCPYQPSQLTSLDAEISSASRFLHSFVSEDDLQSRIFSQLPS
jgi:hypothetical protein